MEESDIYCEYIKNMKKNRKFCTIEIYKLDKNNISFFNEMLEIICLRNELVCLKN